jgi:hypothetical protein
MDIFKIIAEVGFPIAAALAGGYYSSFGQQSQDHEP